MSRVPSRTDQDISSQSDNQLRMAAYEVLNVFVSNSANDCLHIIAKLSEVVLARLEDTVPMQQQIVSVDDKNTLEEIQTSLTTVLLVSPPVFNSREFLTIGQVYYPTPRTRDQTSIRSYHADPHTDPQYCGPEIKCAR